jgi:predicted dehydrogenase
MGLIDRDPEFKTDRTTSALIDFGEGRVLTFTVSTQAVPYQRVNIFGTKARLEVEIPFNAPQGGAMKLRIDDGKKLGDASAKVIKIEKADQYQLEGEYFSRVVRGKEKLAYGIDDAIQQARILDAVFRSAKSGKWEKP